MLYIPKPSVCVTKTDVNYQKKTVYCKLTCLVVVVVGVSTHTGQLGSHPGPLGLTYLILRHDELGRLPHPIFVHLCRK